MRQKLQLLLLGAMLLFGSCEDKVDDNYETLSSVKFEKSEISLPLGEKRLILAQLTPSNALPPKLEWSSSAPEMVSVSQDGVVEALSSNAGEPTTITAKVQGGEISGKFDVRVTKEVTSLELDPSAFIIKPDADPKQIGAVVEPADSNTTLIWSSSNDQIATIDQDGVLTPVAEGEVTITAVVDGQTSMSARSVATVTNDEIDVTNITLSGYVDALDPREIIELTAVVTTANYIQPGINWSSSLPSVASYEIQEGVTVDSSADPVHTFTYKAYVLASNISGTTEIEVTSGDMDKSVSVEVERIDQWYIGDYYPTYNDPSTAAGVVFKIAAPNIHILSLDEGFGAFSTENTNFTNGNGSATLAMAKAADPTLEKYPIFKWCEQRNIDKVKGIDTWGIPFVNEYKTPNGFYDYWAKSPRSVSIKMYNKIFTDAGGVGISETYYHTASLKPKDSFDTVWPINFINGAGPAGKKSTEYLVRASAIIGVPSTVSLTSTTMSATVGDAAKSLTASLDIADPNATYEWSVTPNDNSVVTLSSTSGSAINVTIVAKGSAAITVTAKTATGAVIDTETCNVTVSSGVVDNITDIAISGYSSALEPWEGVTLSAVVTTTDGAQPTLSWESDAKTTVSIAPNATVTDNGDNTFTFTAEASSLNTAGTATITAKIGTFSDTQDVEVVRTQDWYVKDYYPTHNDATTAKGVVCSVAAAKILIISLDESPTTLQWATSEATESQINTTGFTGIDLVKAVDPTLENYPVYKWCNAKNTSGGMSWYIPSGGDLLNFYKFAWNANEGGTQQPNPVNRAAFNKRLTDAGGSAMREAKYFTCTEKSSTTVIAVDYTGTETLNPIVSKQEENYVRAFASINTAN